MHLPVLNLSAKEPSLLALLLFLIAWLLGNVGLIMGFEVGARVPAATVFCDCLRALVDIVQDQPLNKRSRINAGRGGTQCVDARPTWYISFELPQVHC
jgi:hypothetical protein